MLSPILLGTAVNAADSRSQVMKKLAADLAAQAQTYSAQLERASQSTIWNENLDKLRPALNRQRQTLLTAKPLLGLLSSSDPEPNISPEIVGSVSQTSIKEAPSKPLARFRHKLAKLASGTAVSPLTILHIGHSAEGSTGFHENLRRILQDQFGDGGPGMIAPARGLFDDESASVELTKSGRWRMDTVQQGHRHGFGLTAMRATSRSSLSSMTVTSKKNAFDWVGVTIATGPSQGTFKFKVGEVEREFDAQADVPGSKFFKLSVAGNSATIHPGGGAQTAILSWSTGRKQPGIRYVHFDLLSGKAKEMERLEAHLVVNDLRNIKPDLIVFDTRGLSSSGRAVQDLISQMRASSAQADVLFLGPDKYQVADLQSCLGNNRTQSKGVNRFQLEPTDSDAIWQWSPSRSALCALEGQSQQGTAGIDAGIIALSRPAQRASALAKWLVDPSQNIGKVAQR